jgi:hypothetical protein
MELPGELGKIHPGTIPPNPHKLKPARARISKKKRAKGLRLLQELQFLADGYPEFAKLIHPAIAAVKRETERTYGSDRERVVLAIEQGAFTVDDIIDDTGLSRWDVQKILDELVELKFVERSPRKVSAGIGETTEFIYTLTHRPPNFDPLKPINSKQPTPQALIS